MWMCGSIYVFICKNLLDFNNWRLSPAWLSSRFQRGLYGWFRGPPPLLVGNLAFGNCVGNVCDLPDQIAKFVEGQAGVVDEQAFILDPCGMQLASRQSLRVRVPAFIVDQVQALIAATITRCEQLDFQRFPGEIEGLVNHC